MGFYINGDYCTTSYKFEGTNKKYRMVVKGASSNSSTASVSVYIGGKKVGTVGFTGTTLSEQSLEFKMTDVTGKQEIKIWTEPLNPVEIEDIFLIPAERELRAFFIWREKMASSC